MKRAKGREGGSRMSVSVLRKVEEEEGYKKILAVFLPSLLFCFPPADRDYYGQGGRRGRWTAAKMPIPFAAADCPGRRERGVGLRRRDPVDSRRHGCRSGLIAHFNIQRSRGGGGYREGTTNMAVKMLLPPHVSPMM